LDVITSERDRPRLLLLSMYPLDAGRSGPTVRITNMRSSLQGMVQLDVVSGFRRSRAAALGRYFTSGGLRGLAGIYVESSTALPGLADIAFLAAARRRGIPVLTYIRDAYQLFPEYWTGNTPKMRLGRRMFLPALRQLARASSVLAFPSQGLANAVSLGRGAILLPPGAPEPITVARRPDANRLLVVGSLRFGVLGADLLIDAVDQVRTNGHTVDLVCVCRPGDEPPGPRPSWMHLERTGGAGIHALLPGVFATVIPRRRSPYNDFAVPVKVMDYMSYGRPMLVTDCTETARIVRTAGSGLVVADTAAALADGIAGLFTETPERLERYAEAARAAAIANSWNSRAAAVVATLLELKASGRPRTLRGSGPSPSQ
jgi:glycosyl transferase family 1